jgi:hypothetical protein
MALRRKGDHQSDYYDHDRCDDGACPYDRLFVDFILRFARRMRFLDFAHDNQPFSINDSFIIAELKAFL